MDFSVTTDYAIETGDLYPYLVKIAESGFTSIHWCQHWNTDFLYSRYEIDEVARWLKELNLKLLNLHGSSGREKNWISAKEYERLAGVELVKNRIDMTASLGGDVVIMHVPDDPNCPALRKSLDELQPFTRERGIRIAVENLIGNFATVRAILAEYDSQYIGFCYDSGHGNITGDGLEQLGEIKDRLIALHLHDNDGISDEHKLPFSGTVDWKRLGGLIAESVYDKPLNFEILIRNTGIEDEKVFLRQAFEDAQRLWRMINK